MNQFSKFLALGLLTAAVPLASATTINFGSCTYNGNTCPSTTGALPTTPGYDFQGYDISQAAGSPMFYNMFQGDNAPGVSSSVASSNGTFSVVEADGGMFDLSSLDIGSVTGPTTFLISGYATTNTSGAALWTLTGTVTASYSSSTGCPTGTTRGLDGSGNTNVCYDLVTLTGSGGTVSYSSDSITGHTGNDLSEVADITVKLTDGSSSYGYVDNLAVNAAPEPSSLMLLGTGLVSACGVLYRKRRGSIA